MIIIYAFFGGLSTIYFAGRGWVYKEAGMRHDSGNSLRSLGNAENLEVCGREN
jgi:hypothetical protein